MVHELGRKYRPHNSIRPLQRVIDSISIKLKPSASDWVPINRTMRTRTRTRDRPRPALYGDLFPGLVIIIKLCAGDLLAPTLVLSPMHDAGSSHLPYLIRLKTPPCKILSDPPLAGPIHGIVAFHSAWGAASQHPPSHPCN